MESRHSNNRVLLELTQEEALVLLEWLSRFNKVKKHNLFEDQSEERVLWDIEAVLEKITAEIFDDSYAEALSKARKEVRD